MRAGTLRNRIQIEERTIVYDEVGDQAGPWAVVLETDAYINPLSGAQRLLGRQLADETTHEITMRFWAPLSRDKHRIRYRDRLFHILEVLNDDERDRSFTLRCTEGIVQT